jgi:hypothetical protein
MFKEVLVGEHSTEHTPGRVSMLEFVGIEGSMQDNGYPRQEKASAGEHDTIGPALHVASQGDPHRPLERSLSLMVLHFGHVDLSLAIFPRMLPQTTALSMVPARVV